MKAEQERVSNLLTDTVTLLCRNGLHYKSEMKVQGLLGITLDDEVFLVHIDKKFGELFGSDAVALSRQTAAAMSDSAASDDNNVVSDGGGSSTNSSTRRRKRRKRSPEKWVADTVAEDDDDSSGPEKIHVKSEPDEDLMVIEDDKMGLHDKDTMRESYGVGFDTEHFDNGPAGEDVGPDPPGCSTWDDPLSALTDQNSSLGPVLGGNSGGGEDSLDQQTMSTLASTFRVRSFATTPRDTAVTGPPTPRGARGHFPCPVQDCGKVFSFSTSMYRHKRVVHNIRAKLPRELEEFGTQSEGLYHMDYPSVPLNAGR